MNNFKCFSVVIISFFIHGTLCDKGVSFGNNTMYDSIIHNCTLFNTYDKSLNSFQNQQIFVKCKNWSDIKSITSSQQFEGKNVNNIRCLLYYETFLSFCKDLPPSSQKNYEMILAESVSENITTVEIACKNLSLLPKMDHQNLVIRQIIKDDKACKYLCSEYNKGVLHLNIMCAKSYYYNNLKFPNDTNNSASEKSIGLVENKGKIIISQKNEEQSSKIVNQKVTGVSDSYDHNYVPLNKAPQTPNIDVVADSQDNNLPVKSKTLESLSTQPNEKPPLVTAGEDIIPAEKKDLKENSAIAENGESLDNVPNDQMEEKQIKDHNEIIENVSVDIPNLNQNNEEDYDGIIAHEHKDNYVTQSEVLNKISRQGEAISNTFEAFKDDRYSESYNYNADMEGNSYFFTYFSFICVAFIIGYVGYHNKQKVVALLLEGRHSRRTQRDRRPNSANYHKLDTTLEEAISSSCSKNTNYVIY